MIAPMEVHPPGSSGSGAPGDGDLADARTGGL
jgi:hypothetical protein